MAACALTSEVRTLSDDTGGTGHLQAVTGTAIKPANKPGAVAGLEHLRDRSANLQHQLPVCPADEQEQDLVAPGNLLHFLQIADPDPVDRDDDVAAS